MINSKKYDCNSTIGDYSVGSTSTKKASTNSTLKKYKEARILNDSYLPKAISIKSRRISIKIG